MPSKGADDDGVSLEGLHYVLWLRRTGDTIRIKHADLAEELDLSRQRVSQVIAELTSEGRLAPTTERSVYSIVDPALYVVPAI